MVQTNALEYNIRHGYNAYKVTIVWYLDHVMNPEVDDTISKYQCTLSLCNCTAAVTRLIEIKYQIIKRSEEHTSELQSLEKKSYAVFCLQKKKYLNKTTHSHAIND